MRGPAAWGTAVRELGAGFVELLGAEVTATKRDLQHSARTLGGASALVLAGAAVLFWTVGALGWLEYELLRLVLPAWGAAGVLVAQGLLLSWLLIFLGRRRLRRVETPVALVRRRVDDHLAWWSESLVPSEPERGSDDPPL